jgi:GNAT superfamily N-acetyltransferase
MVQLVQIDTSSRREIDRFVRMQFDLYKDDKYWVPPLWSDARMQLDRKKNPYYEHSDAQFYVAVKDGRDVGRIALLENRLYNKFRQAHTGFFYLFESIDDLEVSRALFGRAEEWARGLGYSELFGPKGFLTMDGFGILVEGFDYLPALAIPYNYAYYDRLLVDWGFEKFTDVFSCRMDPQRRLDERIYRVAERVEQRGEFSIKKFSNKKEMLAMLPALIEAYNHTFINNWEFVPMTQREGDAIIVRLGDILDPTLIKFVMKDGEIAGFIIAYPNVGEALQKTGGKLWPFGFIRILRALKTTKRLDLNGIGVLPKYQGAGSTALMYAEMSRTVSTGRFDFAELIQVEEKNSKMQAELTQVLGAELFKKHRLYTKKLV